MNVLILKNIQTEGPGTIEEFLKEHSIKYQIVEWYKGQVQVEPDPFTHLVIMGGPMAVYEMDKYPFLRTEAEMIEKFIKQQKHVLGICLGAQMIAHVLGAKVYPGNEKEIGWYYIQLTDDALKDNVMASLRIEHTSKAEVFQWHGDTFELPYGAIRLASSELYPNQAFRYRDNVYALQFHIEVTPQMLKDWFADKAEHYITRAEEIFEDYLQRAIKFYKKFFLTNL